MMHRRDPAMSLNLPSSSPEPASNPSQEPSALVAKGDQAIGVETTPRSLSAADLLGRVVAARDLDKQQSSPPCWLWHGYLGPGKVTLLTSQWKSGKTTLVSLLLARMQQGGRLAGLPVAAGKAFVISEESESDWRLRFQHLGIRDHVDLLCRPFMAQASMDQWLTLIATAAALRERRGSDLTVIDSLSYFLPAQCENSAGALLECLKPLQRLTMAGMSVLLPHHPSKGKTTPGQAARGSGALPSFVDVIIEMAYYSRPDDLDRRRRLVAFSRHDETVRHLLMELQADGKDYVVLQSGLEAAVGESWPAILHVLSEAHSKLTRQEILERWPADYGKPDSTTLWRWMSRAVAQGVVRQQGTGRTRDPFRYWLPAREDMMCPDGGTREEMQAWNDRMLVELVERMDDGGTKPSEAAPGSKVGEASTETSMAVQETETPPPQPAPLPDGLAANASPLAAGPEESKLTDAPDTTPLAERAEADRNAAVRETSVRLPFPFNIMRPEDVPEEVRHRAR
jgi:hypothetical protein